MIRGWSQQANETSVKMYMQYWHDLDINNIKVSTCNINRNNINSDYGYRVKMMLCR